MINECVPIPFVILDQKTSHRVDTRFWQMQKKVPAKCKNAKKKKRFIRNGLYIRDGTYRHAYQSYITVPQNKTIKNFNKKDSELHPSFQHVNCVNKTFLKSSAI